METIQYCQHGCGQLATYTTKGSRWNSPFKGKPVHQCSQSHHACPAIKQKKIDTSRKNFGTDYPQQNKDHMAKIVETNINKYGHACSLKNPEQQAKRTATLLERYGVEHPTMNDTIRRKAANSIAQSYIEDSTYATRIIKTRSQKYGVDYASIVNKTRDTQIANGRWVAPENRTAWNLYKFNVRQLTAKAYTAYKHLLNPLDLPIGVCAYQLDHIYSIRHGFANNIPYQIIANFHNLQVLWHIDNKSKHIQSNQTIQELVTKIIGT